MNLPVSLIQSSFNSVEYLQLGVDLALKSGIVLLIAASLALCLRKSSAATRHLVWSLAVAGILAIPVLMISLPAWRAPLLPSPWTSAPTQTSATEILTDDSNLTSDNVDLLAMSPKEPLAPIAGLNGSEREDVSPPSPQATGARNSTINWGVAALAIWLAGTLVVLIRILSGVLRVRGLMKYGAYIIDYPWGSLVKRLTGQLRLSEHVALVKSEDVTVPMTWGVWSPVVLLPDDADEWSGEWRRIVLLHELAHIKRRDCLTQLLAQMACALYWFNPLVWFAARRLRVERELACDDCVLKIGTKASDYAGYLVEIARGSSFTGIGSQVAVGMACSQLETRVRAILDPALHRSGLSRRMAWSLAISMACLVTALATLQPWASAAASTETPAPEPVPTIEPIQPDISVAVPVSQVQAGEPGRQTDQTREKHAATEAQHASDPAALLAQSSEPASTPAPAPEPAPQDRDDKKPKATTSLTPEAIIQMKMHGITPEYVAALHRLGFDELSTRDLIQLGLHGVTESFIKEALNAANEKLSVDELVQLRISGITRDYIEEMKKAGYDLPLKSLSKMRMFGVTPSFVQTMRSLGYGGLTPEQLTALKMHGVSEAYVKALRDAGYDKLSVDQLARMSLHGVTSAYVKEMRDAGFDKLSADELIRMRMFGVTGEYVRKMRAAGFKNITSGQLIDLKIKGIDKILLKEKKEAK